MSSMPARPFDFDPRQFITGPLRRCPQCDQVELGTLHVANNVHVRRCRGCRHEEAERLLPLAKKVIYLDQMVISGIAKELDPVWRKKTKRRDDFWLQAFDQLDRLVKLQLIVCPYSPIHAQESSSDDRFESVLQRLYKHLATGVRLRFPREVLMTQLAEAFEAWFAGRDPDWSRITRDQVIRGGLDQWSDRLLITAKTPHGPGQVSQRRASRDNTHAAYADLWKKWASLDTPFEDQFQEERRGAAWAALESLATHLERWRHARAGIETILDPNLAMPGWPVQLIYWLLRRLEERGVAVEERGERAYRFLYSEEALSAPENHLGALLHAALWRRAAGGQRCPSRGTPNDIRFIAAYLPYCDAMFVDDGFAQLLSEGPLDAAVEDYRTKIFSTRSRDEFLDYLSELETAADPTHIELVKRTYGDSWTEPYRTILEHERSRQGP